MIKREVKRLVLTTLMLSLLLTAFSLAVQRFGLLQWYGNSIYALLVLFSFAFSLLFVIRTRKSFMHELIEIDARFGLKDRLSTAYECHQLGRKSIFVDLLIEQASSFIELIKPDPIFPRKFSRIHILIPFFIAVIIALLLVDFSPTSSPPDLAGQEKLKQIGLKLEKYSKLEKRAARKEKKRSREDIYQRMEELARELKAQRMTKRRLLESLNELIKEAGAEKIRLARQLEAELSLGDISGTPGFKNLGEDKVAPNQVKELKKQIKQAFEQGVPASLSQELSNLDRTQKLEQFLDETMNEVMSAIPDKGQSSSEAKKDVFVAQVSEKTTNQDTSSEQALAASEVGGEERKKVTSISSGKDRPDDMKPEKDRPALDEEETFTAGRGKADGEKKTPYEIKSSKSPALKDKGVEGPGERYNIHVRSLPTIAKAKLREEEVIRSYRQELENVLLKEDIPLNYREYIKNYFLSIGLRMEKNGKSDTN
ncbi:MAG: hypothetical protein JRI54_03135 [Deltaproteobacteria bacterium]|nr:hypothetical protein [Deltaproteobacteria bacterium]